MHQVSILWVNHLLSNDGPYAQINVTPDFTRYQLLSGIVFVSIMHIFLESHESDIGNVEVIAHLLNIVGIPVGNNKVPSIYLQGSNSIYLVDMLITLFNTLNPDSTFNLDTSILETNGIGLSTHVFYDFRSLVSGLTISDYNTIWT